MANLADDTFIFVLVMFLSLFTIYAAFRILKAVINTVRDYKRYRLLLSNPEQFVLYEVTSDNLKTHPQEQQLIDEAIHLNFEYLGSITTPYTSQREDTITKTYTNEDQSILLTIETANGQYIAALNSIFEDGFWLQTTYPHSFWLEGDNYEINGLKTNLEQAYDFHEGRLDWYFQEHGPYSTIRNLQTGLDLINSVIQRDHPVILPIAFNQIIPALLIYMGGVLVMLFMLVTYLWPYILFGEPFIEYTPYFFILLIILLLAGNKWGNPKIFTSANQRKKKKHGDNHPFDEA